jgi:eukaryotic-like serine/threonine-protein kinase
MPLAAGSSLGPDEIPLLIGAGGMGEVYRARDSRLGRDVALKLLLGELADDPIQRQRLELEVRAVAAVSHSNIVALFDVGRDDDISYIVSELVDGESLRRARLSLRKALDIAVQIAGGLAAAHEAGIVHRDLKPENILLTRDGRMNSRLRLSQNARRKSLRGRRHRDAYRQYRTGHSCTGRGVLAACV